MVMAVTCYNCGASVAGEDHFCPVCGEALRPETRPEPISVFYSYSHKDEDLRAELEAHLAALRRSGLIQDWHDRKVLPGQNWDQQIDKYLQSATVILLLISADFLNSNYISNVELKTALERQRAGDAVVIPIILRPVLWKVIPEIAQLQALPEDAKPVTEWPSHDAAFVSISEGILAVVLSRASGKVAGPGPGLPRPIAHTRRRRRVIDAAMPAEVPVGHPSALLVMIRRTDSAGLRVVVNGEPRYGITGEDIANKSVMLQFPADENGIPTALDLSIRVEAPRSQPPLQTKNISVPPRGDSDLRLFFLTPTEVGPMLVNLEVCRAQQIVASCVLSTVAVPAASTEQFPKAQTIISTALLVSDAELADPSDSGPVNRIKNPYHRDLGAQPYAAPAPIPLPSQQPRPAPSPGPPSSSEGLDSAPLARWPVLIILVLLLLAVLLFWKHC